jgi:hypothetical protein
LAGGFQEGSRAIRGLLEPDLSVGLMFLAIAIAVVVGIVSGLYPAWRSSQLNHDIGEMVRFDRATVTGL